MVVAIESNTYEPGGDTPEDVAYTPVVELWVQLPQEDTAACDESRARVYSVKFGAWSLLEHRCETDESGHVWAVTHVERLGAFALVIDDTPCCGDTYNCCSCCRGDADRHTCFGACGCSAAHITAGTSANTDTNSDTYTYAFAQRETGIGADNRSGSDPDCGSDSHRIIGSNSTSIVWE